MAMRVVVTRRIPAPGLAVLRDAGAEIDILQEDEEQGVPRDVLLRAVQDCDVLVSLLTEAIDREVLELNPGLRGVANMAVGFNNVDTGAATEMGIPVSNTPGVLTDTTADATWAMILGVARRIAAAHQYTVAGRYRLWGPNLFTGADVSPGGSGERKTLGIVGFGRIGRAVAKRAQGFDMTVLAYDPFARDAVTASPFAHWSELDELLARSDFLTLHVLLNTETHHLIGERELRAMKSTAYLINAARGPVVDEKALVKALAEGWIAGAALDVYEEEPELAPGLAELSNVLLLPHIASASSDTRGRMAVMAATNALAHLHGEPAPNCVNPEVYQTEAYRARS